MLGWLVRNGFDTCRQKARVRYRRLGIAATLILIAFGVTVAPVMILGILGGAFASEQHVAVRKRFLE